MCFMTPWGPICLPDWPILISTITFLFGIIGYVKLKLRNRRRK